jgi:heme O synthase-like polyprenyltransferase
MKSVLEAEVLSANAVEAPASCLTALGSLADYLELSKPEVTSLILVAGCLGGILSLSSQRSPKALTRMDVFATVTP